MQVSCFDEGRKELLPAGQAMHVDSEVAPALADSEGTHVMNVRVSHAYTFTQCVQLEAYTHMRRSVSSAGKPIDTHFKPMDTHIKLCVSITLGRASMHALVCRYSENASRRAREKYCGEKGYTP